MAPVNRTQHKPKQSIFPQEARWSKDAAGILKSILCALIFCIQTIRSTVNLWESSLKTYVYLYAFSHFLGYKIQILTLELSNGTWNLIGLEHLDPSHLINYTCQNVYTFLTPVKDCCHALFAGQQNKKVVIIFTKFSSQNPETKEVQSYSTMDFI